MDIQPIARDPAIRQAVDQLRASEERTLAEMVEITRIPAPPFGEEARAEWLARRFGEVGLERTSRDEIGNVMALLPGGNGGAPVLVAAHLDTVFPAGTRVDAVHAEDRILGPGIADNGRGVAALLALARALIGAGVATEHPVVFIGTVGEEGLGDLRGVKHLFRENSPWREAFAFITIDGTGRRRIVHRALGSRRLRVTWSGPGGHSWADWGIVNPVHALGAAVADIGRAKLPRSPRTTATVARIGGGTSVNAIPSEAWLELDLRSETRDALAAIEESARDAIQRATTEVNGRRRRATAPLGVEIELIGDRPSGETPASAPLVRAARAATRLIGQTPELVASSTDANVPISLGIPAIAMGAGGESGGMHTLDEWYSNDGGVEGLERALLTVIAAAGLRHA